MCFNHHQFYEKELYNFLGPSVHPVSLRTSSVFLWVSFYHKPLYSTSTSWTMWQNNSSDHAGTIACGVTVMIDVFFRNSHFSSLRASK
jgi:hypothetical protein